MLTRSQNTYIRSLGQQKFRNEYKAFVAEGEKMAREWLLSEARIQMIVATNDWVVDSALIARHPECELHIVKDRELAALSGQQTPNKVLLVAHMPEPNVIPQSGEWYLALDEIQDPGNAGTILRIADWYGIRHVVCSPGCADVYNSKVVQSAMGAHLRVNTYESELLPFLSSTSLPKYAATLNGKSVYQVERSNAGVLIIGNESKGVSEKVLAQVTAEVTIPRKGGAESLNAAVSTGILCALLLPC